MQVASDPQASVGVQVTNTARAQPFLYFSYLLEHIIVLLTMDLVHTVGMKQYQILVQSYLV